MLKRHKLLLCKATLFLLLFCTLSSCQNTSPTLRTNLEALEELRRFAQEPEHTLLAPMRSEILAWGEEAPADIQRWPIPEGLLPVGQIAKQTGFFLQDEGRQILWLVDLESGERGLVIDLRDTENSIAETLIFDERRLLWIERSSWHKLDGGGREQECRLMLGDLLAPVAEAILLDTGIISAEDSLFMPFDSFALEGDYLVYRFSSFNGGWRDTQVKLIDLSAGTTRTLAATQGSAGRMILHCSMDGGLIAWDLQSTYQDYQENLPPLRYAAYDLFTYQLDSSLLARNVEPLKQISRNFSYFWPCVFRQQLLVTDKESILHLIPMLQTSQIVVDSTNLLSEELTEQLYGAGMLKHDITISQPNINKRFLSWRSNAPVKHLLFDFNCYGFVSLPEEYLEDDDHPLNLHQPSYWLSSLTSLDADCFVLGFLGEDTPRFILRLE